MSHNWNFKLYLILFLFYEHIRPLIMFFLSDGFVLDSLVNLTLGMAKQTDWSNNILMILKLSISRLAAAA